MIDKNSIFILIRYKNGCYSDWIEISPEYLKGIKAILMNKSHSEFVAILDRNDIYPLLVRISEIQSIEVDIPTEDEI